MCFLKSLHICQCPYSIEYSLDMKKVGRSPLDAIGYKAKCCGFVSLKTAAIVIAVITMIWAALEIQMADKIIGDIFSDRNSSIFFYSKLMYACSAAFLMLACGILLIGVVMTKSIIINIFVCYAFIFNIITIALNIAGFILKVVTLEKKLLKQTLKFMGSLFWNFLTK
ncbi:uncharacterized protein LOC124539612 [Vanessa cardui]|uniref:uncharacterized protein LOC124539612 n=1 Tax=Vanessa cardui TaxID=171605 RepID=UPI001F1446E1|nr:uncharacterized protein LOC124539612 [Vanessa cardui]